MNGQHPPPPPPPPHGHQNGHTHPNTDHQHGDPRAKPGDSSRARSGGLPPGNYDIFVIPPHAAGSGFLYLPSMQVNRNSFLAGAVCALAGVAIYTICIPVLKEWTQSMAQSGGAGMFLLISGVGVLGWAYGKTQMENSSTRSSRGRAEDASGGDAASGGPQSQHRPQQDYTNFQPPPPGAGFQANPGGFAGGSSAYTGAGPAPGAGNTSQRPFTGAGAGASASASETWKKAREEQKKREEERKRKEAAEEKAKADAEKKKWEDARKRQEEARERMDKVRKEREAKEKVEKLAEEMAAKLAKEAQEKAAKEAAAAAARAPPPPPRSTPSKAGAESNNGRYKQPTAKTDVGDDDAFSFRPYDTPGKRPVKTTSQSSIYSETPSWAGSHSTARTTPPPSVRGPYSTNDPDKIIIKGVYAFTDSFQKPVAQLVSKQGHITDGLILKMTTEGLFVDDDVRGVGQREWDVKAWTMKLVEVWCPSLSAKAGPITPVRYIKRDPLQRFVAGSVGLVSSLSDSEMDTVIADLAETCRSACVLSASNSSRNGQTGELKGKYHIVRASVRDTENKRYVFVIPDSESWKVALGLQRVRRGSLVRSLGVSGITANESRNILASLGWT